MQRKSHKEKQYINLLSGKSREGDRDGSRGSGERRGETNRWSVKSIASCRPSVHSRSSRAAAHGVADIAARGEMGRIVERSGSERFMRALRLQAEISLVFGFMVIVETVDCKKCFRLSW